MNLVKTLESIGATYSLNEFENVEELLHEKQIDTLFLSKIKTEKVELVCMIFPEQDEPEEDDSDDSEEVNS